MKVLPIAKLKLALKVVALLPLLGLSYYFLWDGIASPMAISYLPPGGYEDLNGSVTQYSYPLKGVPKLIDRDEVVDLKPNRIGARIRAWNVETMALGVKQDRHGGPECFEGFGFWHLDEATQEEGCPQGPELGSEVPIGHSKVQHLGQNSAELDLRFIFLNGIRLSDWTLNGPIPLKLYYPLKQLLADCALEPDYPQYQSLKLFIPVITGKDRSGKDIIAMKPLISKIVTSGPNPVQVFTGNKKEDKYLDKKFNTYP